MGERRRPAGSTAVTGEEIIDRMRRALIYLWAGPTTLVGLLALLLTLASGGRAAVVGGVLEVSGGFATGFLRRWPVRARAMTLGHVVLGRDRAALASTRVHERAHVRQAERWGPLFLPAYAAASLWAFLRGGHRYLDNHFEVEARRSEREPRRGPGESAA
jgi:hypothetical protein